MTMSAEPSVTAQGSRVSWSSSKAAFVSRILLGLVLVSGGINNLLARNPVPNPTPAGDHFLEMLLETGYMLQVVAITELAVAVLLLWGRFIPLALVVFAPVLVNIALFHFFIQFAGIEFALLAAGLYGHLVYIHRDRFANLLSA